MASFEPTTTQKNAVLDVLRGSGLDPAAGFEWVERRSAITQSGYGRPPYTVQALVHHPTGYWFQFDVDAQRSSLWAI